MEESHHFSFSWAAPVADWAVATRSQLCTCLLVSGPSVVDGRLPASLLADVQLASAGPKSLQGLRACCCCAPVLLLRHCWGVPCKHGMAWH